MSAYPRRARFTAEGTQLSQASVPNALWCTDFKGEFRLGDGRYCYPAMGSAVERAAEELLAWDTKGPRWTKAVQSCVDVFEGRVSPKRAAKRLRRRPRRRAYISRLSRRYHGNPLVRPSGVRED